MVNVKIPQNFAQLYLKSSEWFVLKFYPRFLEKPLRFLQKKLVKIPPNLRQKAALVLIFSYFLADTSSLFVGEFFPAPKPVPMPVPRYIRPKVTLGLESYNAIVGRNIFNSEGLIPDDVSDSLPRKTAFPWILRGTVIMKNAANSLASIEDTALRTVYTVQVDDIVDERAKITAVEPLRVTFLNLATSHLEYIENREDALALFGARRSAAKFSAIQKKAPASKNGVSKVDETTFELQRDAVDESLQNLGEVLSQARAIPHLDDGVPGAYKLVEIQPGSIYEQLGLQNGDVICGVNGDSSLNPAKAMEWLSQLKQAKDFNICVKRNGRKMDMNYGIRG